MCITPFSYIEYKQNLHTDCIWTCFIENRQRGRFAGFSLYLSNTGKISGSTLCYKDKQDLPHVGFSIVCAEYGRYVIFYNERLDVVTYPDGYELLNVYIELCEVTVKGKYFISLHFHFTSFKIYSILLSTALRTYAWHHIYIFLRELWKLVVSCKTIK